MSNHGKVTNVKSREIMQTDFGQIRSLGNVVFPSTHTKFATVTVKGDEAESTDVEFSQRKKLFVSLRCNVVPFLEKFERLGCGCGLSSSFGAPFLCLLEDPQTFGLKHLKISSERKTWSLSDPTKKGNEEREWQSRQKQDSWQPLEESKAGIKKLVFFIFKKSMFCGKSGAIAKSEWGASL